MSLLGSPSTVHLASRLDDLGVEAVRSDAVTQEFLTEVLRDDTVFDPDRESARWRLLTRAHRRATSGLASGHAASC